MTQLERLIARLVQLAEDSPGQMITVTVVIDNDGTLVCWRVEQARAEGLQNS